MESNSDQYLKNSPLKRELEINSQHMVLLLGDPDFINWAKTIRKRFGIPAKGFVQQSPMLKKWLVNLDQETWHESLQSIYAMYTKISEAMLPYIEGYLKFGKISSEPLFSYKVFYPQKDSKTNGPKVEIYNPLTNKEWQAIKSAVDRYFTIQEVSASKPIKVSNKLLSLQGKKKLTPTPETIGYQPLKETDLSLIAKKYPNASPQKGEKLARNLPKERERAKKLLRQWLGKV